MFYRSSWRWVAAATSNVGSPHAAAAATATTEALAPFSDRVEAFCKKMHSAGASFRDITISPNEEQCRGLTAKCAIPEGSTVMSVPLRRLAISSEALLQGNAHVREMNPPSFDEVRHLMSARSMHDPVLYEQVYLALLVAADHMNPASPNNDYYCLLPHPAIDDAHVIQHHKQVLDPLLLVEWDDHQKEMLAVLHLLLRRWDSPHTPPIQLAYWALRTVFSRMHLLPKAGLAPQQIGSSLSYTAQSAVDRADLQTRWRRRFKSLMSSLKGNPTGAEEYHLAPTLVPLLDLAPHLPSSNVEVAVNQRAGDADSYVELRALRNIEEGEAVGLRFNSSQSPAFLLFRFGFIPQ